MRLGEVFQLGTQIYIPSEFELRGNIFFWGAGNNFSKTRRSLPVGDTNLCSLGVRTSREYIFLGGQQFFQDSVKSSSWGHKFIFPRSSNFEGIYFFGGRATIFPRLGGVFQLGTQIYVPSEFELRGNIFFWGWATTFLRLGEVFQLGTQVYIPSQFEL